MLSFLGCWRRGAGSWALEGDGEGWQGVGRWRVMEEVGRGLGLGR